MSEPEQNRFGLDEVTINRIVTILAECPEVEGALIFGSRAKGNFKRGSDIDLSLLGENLTESQLLQLENALDDLMLPYQFDLNRFSTLQNLELIDHIKRVGKMLYSKPTQNDTAVSPN